ncbi:MAG: hypothetical protein CM1200mP1_05230 [Candidatus Neomarinimicrobiota bacterium]|nr:MAG: hypothetical protein CM1200mP1_05230 [Candidatus Neomarinimicrobiota bacterium]
MAFINLWLGIAVISGPLFFYFSVIKPFINLKRWKNLSDSIQFFTIVTIVPLSYFLGHSLFSKFELIGLHLFFLSGFFLFPYKLKTPKAIILCQIIYSLLLIFIITVQTFKPILPLKGDADITNRYYMYDGFLNGLEKFLNENLN